MPRPYQFRDYPLAVFWALAVATLGLATYASAEDHEVAITVEGTCCDGTACPIVDSLKKLFSTSEVRHIGDGSVTTLALRTTKAARPRHLWDSVAKSSVRPLRIVIDQSEYRSRPLN